MTVHTPLGAQIDIYDAPEHLGPGVLMRLSIADPLDHRNAEVYLDEASMSALAEELEAKL